MDERLVHMVILFLLGLGGAFCLGASWGFHRAARDMQKLRDWLQEEYEARCAGRGGQ